MKLLLVDDDPDIRLLARHALAQAGFEVTVSAGGYAAVAVARELKPDAVLLDLLMPSPDGLELFDALAADAATAGVPVLFLTAKTQPAEVAALLARGARGVIAKPFDPLRLGDEVRRLLAGGARAHRDRPPEPEDGGELL